MPQNASCMMCPGRDSHLRTAETRTFVSITALHIVVFSGTGSSDFCIDFIQRHLRYAVLLCNRRCTLQSAYAALREESRLHAAGNPTLLHEAGHAHYNIGLEINSKFGKYINCFLLFCLVCKKLYQFVRQDAQILSIY